MLLLLLLVFIIIIGKNSRKILTLMRRFSHRSMWRCLTRVSLKLVKMALYDWTEEEIEDFFEVVNNADLYQGFEREMSLCPNLAG